MDRQIHGGDIYRNKVVFDFSVNSNPLGVPGPVRLAAARGLAHIEHYPDIRCDELKKAISRFECIPKENIICGNGAAELFFAAALARKPKRALILSPTFSEYERALKAVGARIQYFDLSEEKDFRVDESLLDRITPGIDMIFLCNPNNPTGCVMKRELLNDVLEKCTKYGILLVLDECFVDFLKEPEKVTMREKAAGCQELLVVKAFTKLFAMPGLRLGYAVSGSLWFLDKMKEFLQPWNVSVLAQAGGIAALTDNGNYCVDEYIKNTRKYVKTERESLEAALKELGYYVYPSEANYLFFRGKPMLYEAAADAGFLIRDCSGYRGLTSGYYRIAIRKKEENERFVAWLRGL
ncbi:histidinol-phosphate transaminase [Lachnospiraceae bacterium 42-17]|jgi:threonine-phosphate decarboxylase|nr:aminotransferase class I/II-fold pyridoxal phosphate-dependent enzyme [Dorea sp.]